MRQLLIFLFHRLITAFVTLFAVTIVLFGFATLSSPESRAFLYIPNPRNDEKPINPYLIAAAIEKHGFNDPFPVQYINWIGGMLQGDWGWSPTANQGVFPALLSRSQATAELTFYAILVFIPLGLAAGAVAGWRRDQVVDRIFRSGAYFAISLPPFILSVIVLGTLYANFRLFPPGRISDSFLRIISEPSFIHFTGLLTIDSLLNTRLDIFHDVLNHLAMPVFTLSLFHWATLGLITRASMIEEVNKDYILTAKAKGLRDNLIYRRHALRNVMGPALNSSGLSAVSLVTGVFVVESIYNYKGVSFLVRNALLAPALDVSIVMGFTIYSVIMVLVIMFVLDFVQALVDPRYREGMVSS